jgi:TetR/AcrR family transcriptional regulator, fatty acid biosynthesis regulator
MTIEKKTRTRLSPNARKSMIMDHAAKLIAAEGVSAVTMERLGKEAGVSKALVYNYYPSVTLVLQDLLTREYRHLRKLQFDAAESGKTLEQLVRRVTHVYLVYIREHGPLIDRLAAEPSVANNGDPTEYSRDSAVEYIAKIFSENFEIDMDIALPIVDISYGLPAAAGHYITRHDTALQEIEDITVIMILGSLEAIVSKHKTSLKPLRRPKSN